MYAGDLADFIFTAIPQVNRLPQYMNVGLGDDLSINEYYKNVAEVIGYNGGFIHDLDKPIGMARKLVDSTLLSSFGWKPKTSLEKGIEFTYEYFKSLKND
jgi:GDP-L-fucose synthase